MANKDYEIVRGRTELRIPHEKGRITFVSPAKGPGSYVESYVDVQKEISDEGLVAPIMARTASLVHVANKNPNEPEFAHVLNTLDNRRLWGFNGVLYVPNQGAYIQDNPEIKDKRVFLDKSELIKKLESGDKSVRFVPFGFKVGEQTAPDLAKNPFVVALAGEEGAEKLAEVSGRYKQKPYVWSFGSVDEEVAGVSGLGGCYGGFRLDVCGYYGDSRSGYAFGVSE